MLLSRADSFVLILVVMEEGQRHDTKETSCNQAHEVLILVVMEEGQRHLTNSLNGFDAESLNPCCNGRGSKTIEVPADY